MLTLIMLGLIFGAVALMCGAVGIGLYFIRNIEKQKYNHQRKMAKIRNEK